MVLYIKEADSVMWLIVDHFLCSQQSVVERMPDLETFKVRKDL